MLCRIYLEKLRGASAGKPRQALNGGLRLILAEDRASILWYNSGEKGDFISHERKRKICLLYTSIIQQDRKDNILFNG